MRKACKRLTKLNEYSYQWEEFQTKPEKNHANAFVSHLVQQIERRCLDALISSLKNKNKEIGTLSYDGITIEREFPAYGNLDILHENDDVKNNVENFKDNNLLPLLSNEIYVTTGYKLNIKVKSLVPTKKATEAFRMTYKSLNKVKPANRMYCLINQKADFDGFMRQGMLLFLAHESIPNVWVKVDFTAEAFIGMCLKDSSDFQSSKMPSLLEWFQSIDSHLFPMIPEQRRYVAFLDKRFDLHKSIP
jgi:hypothetical protein